MKFFLTSSPREHTVLTLISCLLDNNPQPEMKAVNNVLKPRNFLFADTSTYHDLITGTQTFDEHLS